MFGRGYAKPRMAALGMGRGEVDGDARELAGRKDSGEVGGIAGNDQRVFEAQVENELGCVHNAHGLAVHADEQGVGVALRHGGDISALAAAQIEMHMIKALDTARNERAACFGPTAPVRRSAGLDGVGRAFDALVEDEVLGHTCVHGGLSDGIGASGRSGLIMRLARA